LGLADDKHFRQQQQQHSHAQHHAASHLAFEKSESGPEKVANSASKKKTSPLAAGRRSMWRRSVAGLVLLSKDISEPPSVCWEFEAELLVLNNPGKLRVNYEPVVHVGCVQQSARIIKIDKLASSTVASSSKPLPTSASSSAVSTASASSNNATCDTCASVTEAGEGEESKSTAMDVAPPPSSPVATTTTSNASLSNPPPSPPPTEQELASGESGLVTFRFLFHPEYLLSGSSMIIRESRTKGVGKIVRVSVETKP